MLFIATVRAVEQWSAFNMVAIILIVVLVAVVVWALVRR